MEKIKVTVSGTIQNVGYRAKVIGIARAFGLTGFIQNLDDGRVRIIAESKNGDFEKFIDAIRIKNTMIDVLDVEVKYADATGDFADFYKLVGGGETDERLDTAAEYLKEMISVMRTGFSDMRAGFSDMRAGFSDMRAGFSDMRTGVSEMIEKQDAMLTAQSETTDEIRGLREAQNETTEEIRELRGDMKSYMDKKFGAIESELDVIKIALKDSGILC
jgi:acylphosphatase